MSKTTFVFACPHCRHLNVTDDLHTQDDNFVPVVGVFCIGDNCGRAFTAYSEDHFKTFKTRKMDAIDILHNMATAWELREDAKNVFDIPAVMHHEQVMRQLMRENCIVLAEIGRIEYKRRKQ